MPPGYPSADAPWQTGKKARTVQPAKAPPAEPKAAAPAEAAATPPATAPSDTALGLPELPLPETVPQRNHQISVSGDYFLGEGDVTMPFGFSLVRILPDDVEPNVAKPDRTSDYIGATLSYSYRQIWFLDLAYAHGESSGSADVTLGTSVPPIPSEFQITDDWYSAYVRFEPPGLTGKRLKAYFRAGLSYVTAELTDETVFPALGLYKQTDETEDLMGNLGFGARYILYSTPKVRLNLQLEGEGFYGMRSQESLEELPEVELGVPFEKAKIDNDIYGGTGRFTFRLDYIFSDALRIFTDVGFQAKFLQIDYSDDFDLGSEDELLWGPYAKVGLIYQF